MHFLQTISVLSAAFAVSVSAIPTGAADPFNGLTKRTLTGVQLTQCDLSGAQLPKKGSSPQVPDPSSGTRLSTVVIGRGTQNYTCTPGSKDPPRFAGAVAMLYDASCLAAYHSSLLHELTGGFLQWKDSVTLLAAAIAGRISNEHLLIGHHYFSDSTTPVFDFRINGKTDIIFSSKKANVPAPDYSVKGVNNEGFGAVDWLKLESKSGTVGFKEAYRMITAGGNPPPTCENQKEASFTVDYAAEYWFYS
ncbi:MAG: hypothetical protein M1836_004163 [Candelina mexicana]|nr:MAG: hypothetical protein M1836_004163 [Candelina mexicana]